MESIKCKIYSEEEQRRICPESSPMIKFMQRKLSLTRHDESACLQHKRIRYALSECRWDSGKEIDISTLPSKLKHDGREDKAPDLIIEVEGYLIGVHSSILTNYSATLRRMCLNQSKQNENRNKKEPTVICLPCHSVEDLEELIRFAYFPDKEINGKSRHEVAG